MIVSDEPTSRKTFEEYRWRFQVEENFLDLKSNGFQLEACRIRDKFALTQLLWVVALTMLFLVLQGTAGWPKVNVKRLIPTGNGA